MLTPCTRSKNVLEFDLEPISINKSLRWVVGGWVGGLFDFRVTPNPNGPLDEEFDNNDNTYRDL